MNKPKPFAKLFAHATLGQLLVQRDSNEDDKPGIRITFDPAVDQLAPCHIFLSVGGTDEDTANKAADAMFDQFTEDMAASSVEKQVEQIKQMFSKPH